MTAQLRFAGDHALWSIASEWLLTYLLHSSVLLGTVFVLGAVRLVRAPRTTEALWRVALLASVLTASLVQLFAVEPPLGRIELPRSAAPIVPAVPVARAARASIPVRAAQPPTPTDEVRAADLEIDAAPALASESAAFPWQQALVLAVAAFAAIGVARVLLLRARLLRRLRDRMVVSQGRVPEMLRTLCRKARVPWRVRLTSSPHIESPIALPRGEICLPACALEGLAQDEQESMLAHELAHLVRRDPLWLLAVAVVESALFFQPFNRLARRRLQDAAEHLCDAWAVAQVGARLPLARCLARVAEWMQHGSLEAAVPAMAEPKSQLVQRIERLTSDVPMSYRTPRWRVALLSGMLPVLVLLVPGAPALLQAAQPPPQDPRLTDLIERARKIRVETEATLATMSIEELLALRREGSALIEAGTPAVAGEQSGAAAAWLKSLPPEELRDLVVAAGRVLSRRLLEPPLDVDVVARYQDLLAQGEIGITRLLPDHKWKEILNDPGASRYAFAKRAHDAEDFDLEIAHDVYQSNPSQGFYLDLGAIENRDLKLAREVPPARLSDAQYRAWVLLWSDLSERGDDRIAKEASECGLLPRAHATQGHTYLLRSMHRTGVKRDQLVAFTPVAADDDGHTLVYRVLKTWPIADAVAEVPTGIGGRKVLTSRGRRGATQGTEAAVLYGLTWLARHQGPDGSWDAKRFDDACVDGSCAGAGHVRFSDGETGLALLAFLGAGYMHESKQFVKDPRTGAMLSFGDTVRKGLKYLIDKQQPDGSFGSDKYMYNQAICAQALVEAYALSDARFFREPAQRAIAFVQQAQNSDPTGKGKLGWRYQPMEGVSDTSVTGWCVMALVAGQMAGLDVNGEALDGALKWVRSCTNAEGKTGYLSAGDAGQKIENPEEMGKFDHHDTMTAVGMIVRSFVSRDWRDPALERGAGHLIADTPRWEPVEKRDYYYWYQATLAFHQYSGLDSPNTNKTYWNKWNEKLVVALLAHQDNVPEGGTPRDYKDLFLAAGDRGCCTGSFAPSDRFGYAGRVYATAINLLTLETYYRFENAFGRKR